MGSHKQPVLLTAWKLFHQLGQQLQNQAWQIIDQGKHATEVHLMCLIHLTMCNLFVQSKCVCPYTKSRTVLSGSCRDLV